MERSSGRLHPAVAGLGLGEMSSGRLHPAVAGLGLGEMSSGGLHPAVAGLGLGETSVYQSMHNGFACVPLLLGVFVIILTDKNLVIQIHSTLITACS